MKLYKLLIVLLLTYGVPSTIIYIIWQLILPYITTADMFFGALMTVGFIWIVAFVMHNMAFEKDFNEYLR